MARHAKRTDANHADIRDGLRKAGYVVIDTSYIGNGYPVMVRKKGSSPFVLDILDIEPL